MPIALLKMDADTSFAFVSYYPTVSHVCSMHACQLNGNDTLLRIATGLGMSYKAGKYY